MEVELGVKERIELEKNEEIAQLRNKLKGMVDKVEKEKRVTETTTKKGIVSTNLEVNKAKKKRKQQKS